MALMGQDRSSLSIEVIFPDITSFFCWLREGVKEKRKIGTNAFLFLDSHWQTGCLRCSKMQVTTQSEKVKNVACMHFYKIIGHICKAVNENGNLFPPESSNTLSTTFSIAVKIHLFCSSQDISFTTVPKSKSIQDKEASNERKPLVDSSHRSHSSSSYPYTHNPSVLSYEPQHYPTQIQHPSHEVLAPSMVGEAHRPP
ncbi:hypothetical protein AB205_0014010, partial [Aquarana catesbeiana]